MKVFCCSMTFVGRLVCWKFSNITSTRWFINVHNSPLSLRKDLYANDKMWNVLRTYFYQIENPPKANPKMEKVSLPLIINLGTWKMWIPKSLGFDTEMKKIKRAFHLIKLLKRRKIPIMSQLNPSQGGSKTFPSSFGSENFNENRFSSSLFFLLYYFFPCLNRSRLQQA